MMSIIGQWNFMIVTDYLFGCCQLKAELINLGRL